MTATRWLFLLRRGLASPSAGLAGIEMLLTAAAFDQPVSVLFLDDAVNLLLPAAADAPTELLNLAGMLRSMSMYGLQGVYVERESLAERGVADHALILETEIVERQRIATLLNRFDHILTVA